MFLSTESPFQPREFDWQATVPVHFCVIYDHFPAAVTKVSGCSRFLPATRHTTHRYCADPRKKHTTHVIPKRGDWTTGYRASHTYLGKPLMQAAKSLVIKPASMVSMQTSSRALAKKLSSVLLSSFALWANPRDQAKMEAVEIKRAVCVSITLVMRIPRVSPFPEMGQAFV